MLRLLLVVGCITLTFSSFPGRADDAIVIATGDANGPKQPQASVAADGTLHVVFGQGEDILHCSSADGGRSFTKPTVAFRVPNLSLGMRRGPRIAAFGSSLVITAIGGKQGKGRDGDVLAWRSNDAGGSWQGPVHVNDAIDSAREGLHAMAVATDGETWCVWLDLRNERTELYAAKTMDGGATWSANQLVYRSPEKSICECCHPSISIHEKTLQVLFRNSLAGNRDMYLATIEHKPDAVSIETKQMGTESWKLNACPMDGGMLAIDKHGLVSTVWRRGREIFAATNDGSDEQLLGMGEQPWIADTKDGPVAVWSTRRDGELQLKRISGKEVRAIASNARDAVIVAEPVHGTSVFVFWEKNEKNRSSVLAKVVEIPPKLK
jgi:hypothetical protein